MADKKRLLILNGSHSDIPLIKSGKKLGYHVITTGNAPDLIGHQYADEYHPGDFSDKEAILSLARSLEIDAVCSCANDFGAITASYVAEQMGLPGHDPYQTALTLHHKHLFKAFALPHNIPTPYAESYESQDEALASVDHYHFPLIIKPIDLTGGKGVTRVFSRADYENGIHTASSVSPAGKIVVEEYIEGTQHSFTTFILNGMVVFHFSDNEYSYKNPNLVATSAAPATGPEDVPHKLIAASEKIASLLSLGHGVFHIQYLLREGEPYIIEITRRCSGDLYPYPVDYATEVGWADWIVRAATGMDCSAFPEAVQSGFCGRHCIMGPHDGIVEDVIISTEIEGNIFDSLMWWDKGYRIHSHMAQKVGIVCLRFDSMEEMQDKIRRINDLIRIEYR